MIMSEKKIKTDTKSNVWNNVKKIAMAIVPIVIVILTKGKGKT